MNFNVYIKTNWKLLILLTVTIIMIAGLTLLIAGKNHLYDLTLYYQYSQNIFSSHFPYCDFRLEYPPLALLPMIIPQLLTAGKISNLYIYIGLFALQIIVYSVMSVILLSRFKTKWYLNSNQKHLPFKQGIFLITLSPFLLWRYDLFPSLFLLIALLISKSFPMFAGICIAIGFTAKLYPVLTLPFFLIFYFFRKQFLSIRNFLLGFFLTSVLIIGPFLLRCPNRFIESVQFHQLRGLQVQSIPANLLLLVHQLTGFNLEIVKNYGAKHLKTPLAEPLLKVFPIIFLIFYGLLIFNFVRLMIQSRRNVASNTLELISQSEISFLIGYSTLSIALFVVTNKVFSPQYLLWIAPLAPLLSRRLQNIFCGVCLVHVLGYPFLYDSLLKLQAFPILLLTFGNVLMIYFGFQLFRDFVVDTQRD